MTTDSTICTGRPCHLGFCTNTPIGSQGLFDFAVQNASTPEIWGISRSPCSDGNNYKMVRWNGSSWGSLLTSICAYPNGPYGTGGISFDDADTTTKFFIVNYSGGIYRHVPGNSDTSWTYQFGSSASLLSENGSGVEGGAPSTGQNNELYRFTDGASPYYSALDPTVPNGLGGYYYTYNWTQTIGVNYVPEFAVTYTGGSGDIFHWTNINAPSP